MRERERERVFTIRLLSDIKVSEINQSQFKMSRIIHYNLQIKKF